MRYKGKLRVALALSVLTCIAAAMQSGAAQVPPGNGGISSSATYPGFDLKQRVYQELSAKLQEGGTVRVIVQLSVSFLPEGKYSNSQSVQNQRLRIKVAQGALLERLQDFNFLEVRRLETIPVVVLEVDAAALEDLATNSMVASIVEDQPEPIILDQSVPLIGADLAWAEGYTGEGQTVAILDTGVDLGHDFLTPKIVEEACFSTTDLFYASTTVCPNGLDTQIGDGAGIYCSLSIDGCDHGTHVAGIAAGEGVTYNGVAHEASIISIQVFSRFDDESICGGVAYTPCVLSWSSDQLAALDHIAVLSTSYEIAAVNMSLGGGYYDSFCDSDPLASSRKLAIDNLRSMGIATVIASGNSGYQDAIAMPACISSAISVGSTTLSDTISSFSNVADFLSLLAPGSLITSSIPGGSFQSWSGTSMAAPHVTGAWAVMKSKVDDASVTEVLAALRDTGVIIDDGRPGGVVLGMSRIQLDAALPELPIFLDVPSDHWAHDYIVALYHAGYIVGCSIEPRRQYCPDAILNRAESAVFVLRGQYGAIEEAPYPPPATPTFDDVPASHWGYDWVESMWTDGFTAGCGLDPLIYCPERLHPRAEASVFFLRIKNGVLYEPPPPTGIFSDVDLTVWYAPWVEAAFNEGLLPECNSDPFQFCPEEDLDRAWAAYMMVQAKGGLPLPTPTPSP